MNAPGNAFFRRDESYWLKYRYLSVLAGLVLALALAFFTPASRAAPEASPNVKISRDATKLPPEVQRMRQAILQAVTISIFQHSLMFWMQAHWRAMYPG